MSNMPVRKNVVLLVSTISFVSLMAIFSITSILLELRETLELSNTEFGLLLSSFSAFYAAAQIPSGILSDNYGGKRVASISLSVMGIAGILFSFSEDFVTALALRIVVGFSGGFLLPATVRLISDWFVPEERERAMGIYGLGQGLGFFVTYALGSIVVETFGWRMGSLFSGAFVATAAILSWRFLENVKERRPGRFGMGFSLTIRTLFSKTLLLLIAINFGALSTAAGVLQFTPALLHSKFGFSTIIVGLVISSVGVMSMVSSYSGGIHARRWGGRNVIITSMLICTAFPLLLGYSSNEVSSFILIALIGFGSMYYFAPTFAAVPLVADKELSGSAFGIFNTLSFGFSAISPLVFGYVLDVTGAYELAFVSLSGIALFGLTGALLLRYQEIGQTNEHSRNIESAIR